jgi:nickel-type superoxide dismutase maturation protease
LFQRVQVVGRSMLPAIAPGDRLVVVRRLRIRPGAVVALAEPRRPGGAAGDRIPLTLVKRVSAVEGDAVWVHGDNAAESTDSRHWGPVPRRAIHGVAIYRYAPASRAGRLRPR